MQNIPAEFIDKNSLEADIKSFCIENNCSKERFYQSAGLRCNSWLSDLGKRRATTKRDTYEKVCEGLGKSPLEYLTFTSLRKKEPRDSKTEISKQLGRIADELHTFNN